MKILISTLLFPIMIFLEFGGSNASDDTGSSSGPARRQGGFRSGSGRPYGGGRGRFRTGQRHENRISRQSDLVIKFMGHDVSLWLAADRITVLQADFEGNRLPTGPAYYRSNNFLVRLAPIGFHTTVVYISQDGNLLGVRAPKPTNANIMEPNASMWFIVYDRRYFRVTISPLNSAPTGIELVTGNAYGPSDSFEEVIFPWIKFYVFRAHTSSEVTGAALHF